MVINLVEQNTVISNRKKVDIVTHKKVNKKKIGKMISAKDIATHRKTIHKDPICEDIVNGERLNTAFAILENGEADKYDREIFNMVIEKRLEIYKNTGILVPIGKLVEQAIMKGIEKITRDTL